MTKAAKEEVIVYCSNFGCTASMLVYQQLVDHGFQNLSHYEHYAFSQRAAISERWHGLSSPSPIGSHRRGLKVHKMINARS
jgi:hypothetical protein